MKRIVNYIIILSAFFYACNTHHNETSNALDYPLQTIDTQGELVSTDSISPSKINLAKTPELLNIKEGGLVLSYKPNVHPLSQPTVISMDSSFIKKHQILITGNPDVTIAVGKTVSCNLPEPLHIEGFRFKDDASQNIQYLDVAQGLSSSYIRELMEDDLGNIWISDNSTVIKYNGKSTINFSEKNEILSNTRSLLKKDKKGNIWITNKNGLIKYNGKHFTLYDSTNGLPSRFAGAFDFDKDDNIWMASKNSITMFNGKQFFTYSKKQGFNIGKIWSMHVDQKGNVWCGSGDSGIYCFNTQSYFKIDHNSGLLNNEVFSIASDRKGNVWIGNHNGVNKFNGKTLELYTEQQGLIGNIVRNVMVDNNDNVWLSAYRGGMSCFDGKSFTWHTESEGLPISTVDCFIEDKSGNIWAGTDGGGLCKFTPHSFKHFIPTQGFNKIIMAITEDKNNNIWLGSYDDGIYKYNGNTIVGLMDKEKTIGNVITMITDKKGNLWFAIASAGVVKYDGKKFERYQIKEGLFSNEIVGLAEDNDGNIWISSNNEGVFKFNGKQFEQFKKEQGLNSNYVTDMAQDPQGAMWFSTSKGVNKIHKGKVVSFTKEHGLAENFCKNIHVDRKGNVWIGTLGGGISRYDGKKIISITQKQGLSNDFIRSIIEDKEGNTKAGHTGLWLSTDYGITHIVVKDDVVSKSDIEISTFTRNDGLRGEDFCSNSGYMDSKGKAWWGSVKGLTTLQTNEVLKDTTIPQITLDYISLEQNYIDFNSLKDSLANGKDWFIGEKKQLNLKNINFTTVPAFSNYPENLELPYNINNISLHFSAVNWVSGHKIKYQYFLEGSDKEWHPISSENKAIYTNLDFGSYTFKVKAKGVSEIWSTPLEYKFVIHPPWWQTSLAYILYFVAFVFSSFLYLNWRTRALRKKQKELEEIIVERTADVVEEKNKVEEKNAIIEEKQKEILDSLQYAQQIQKLLLANHKLVNETLPDSFVVFKPKDIVSGDFYWAAKKEDRFYLAVCDSTGHGVPGAFMSLLNINFLNEAINEKNIADPNEVFNYVRNRLIDNISQDGRQDGMDGILICVKDGSKKMTYAAANNAPLLIKNNELSILDTDKMPIGKGEKNEPFKLYTFEMNKGDQLYLFTDGFADQFGGPKGKKYKYKPMYELMLRNNHLPVIEQEELLYQEFDNWRGSLEQVDDVCILGIRL